MKLQSLCLPDLKGTPSFLLILRGAANMGSPNNKPSLTFGSHAGTTARGLRMAREGVEDSTLYVSLTSTWAFLKAASRQK